MFLPMSWTSPLTVAMTIVPAVRDSPGRRSASRYGISTPTACFMTRALFTTCGRNMRPDPNRSPTFAMPAMSGPSMTAIGRPSARRASSVSASTWSPTPFTSAWDSRSSTGRSRHAPSPAPPGRFAPASSPVSWSREAASSNRSVASGRRFRTRSSASSRRPGSTSSRIGSAPAFTMPMSRPAPIAWYRNTAWMASRTASLPRNEKLTLLIPPEVCTSGISALIRWIVSMNARP